MKTVRSQFHLPPGSPARSGFTLIEMLVVIAIIALLVALIVPATTKAMDRAARVKCLGNLRQISTATLAWATDNRGTLPTADRNGNNFPHAFPNFDEIFGNMLTPRDQVMFCPGKLRRARNPDTYQYDTLYTTYQYFRNEASYQGRYQSEQSRFDRISTYPSDAAIWGCLTMRKPDGATLAHDEPNVEKPASGMNAVYLDGHGHWVPGENLEVYLTLNGDFYWPDEI